MPTLPFIRFLHAGSGTVISQLVSLACVPILFRLYPPEAFGAWAALMALALLIGAVSTLRYELAIVIERDERDASVLFWFTLLLGITVSVGCGALVGNIGGRLIPALSGDKQAPIFIICVWSTLVVIAQVAQSWFLRRGDFLAVSQLQISSAVVTNATQLLGGWYGASPLWLIAGSVVGQMFATGIALRCLAKHPPQRTFGRWPEIRALAVRHRRFPLFSAPYTLLTIARERAPILVLAALASPAEVGWYSQAWRLVSIPVGVSSSALRPVLFHAAATQGLAAQEQRISRILFLITVIGAPWLGILACNPQTIFGTLLGDAWRNSGTLAAVLAIPAFYFALSNWMDRILDVQGRQDLNLLAEFVTCVLSIGALWVMLSRGFALLDAISAQAAVLALCYVGFIAVAYQISGYRRRTVPQVLALSFVIALGFGFICSVLSDLTTPLAGAALSGIIAGSFSVIMAFRVMRGWV